MGKCRLWVNVSWVYVAMGICRMGICRLTDQPGKVTCVSCADKSICRAHFTSPTFFNLLQQTSVSNKHGKKTLFCPDCCHSSSASPQSFIFQRTLSFQFSVLSVLFGPNASPSPNIFHLFIFRSSSPWMEHSPCSGPGEPFLYCSNFVFLCRRNDLNRSECFFPDQNFAKVFANMMYSFCQEPPCFFKFDFLHKLKH